MNDSMVDTVLCRMRSIRTVPNDHAAVITAMQVKPAPAIGSIETQDVGVPHFGCSKVEADRFQGYGPLRILEASRVDDSVRKKP